MIGILGFGMVLGGATIGAVATGTAQRDSPKAEVGSCASYSGLPSGEGDTAGMVFIPGGTFKMGSERHQPEERFVRTVRVDGFWIDRHEVTNAQFRQFVDATGYRTLAERGLDPKTHPGTPKDLLVPGSVVFIAPTEITRGGSITQWWQYVPGANWHQPSGPGSTIAGKDNHSVVHIAYEDVLEYARWRGHELPTEAQWEFAARGGRDGEDDYSNAYDPDGKPIANTWQGIFPVLNTNDDGHTGTAPVGCFKPNGYGLYDMIGNVWEWTSDWYRPGHSPGPGVNPAGPDLVSLRIPQGLAESRVIKGGSYSVRPQFLRALSTSRSPTQETDLSAAHLGFRTVSNQPATAPPY